MVRTVFFPHQQMPVHPRLVNCGRGPFVIEGTIIHKPAAALLCELRLELAHSSARMRAQGDPATGFFQRLACCFVPFMKQRTLGAPKLFGRVFHQNARVSSSSKSHGFAVNLRNVRSIPQTVPEARLQSLQRRLRPLLDFLRLNSAAPGGSCINEAARGYIRQILEP